MRFTANYYGNETARKARAAGDEWERLRRHREQAEAW